MSEKNQLKLKLTSLLGVPLNVFQNDFTFIVNGEEFETCKIIADLLSPKICEMHASDSTIDKFYITTENQGHFSYYLNLINFNDNDIPEEEIPFISEIVTILKNSYINISMPQITNEKNIDIIIENIKKHEKWQFFYEKVLKQEIEYISSHFYEITDDQIEKISKLSQNTLDRIFRNNNLKLNSEDSLIDFINTLYLDDSSFAYFYEFVDFSNVSQEKMIDFLNIYDINDVNQMTWKSLCGRLMQKIIKNKDTGMKERFVEKGIQIPYEKNNEFNGIFNYIRIHSDQKFEKEVTMRSSSKFNDKDMYTPDNICLIDNDKVFVSKNLKCSYVAIGFSSYKVIPKFYSIKSAQKINYYANCNPKSWVMEASNDYDHWEIIDEQVNNKSLKMPNVVQTFEIKNSMNKEYQYFRLRQTAKNMNSDDVLAINSMELYGSIIQISE